MVSANETFAYWCKQDANPMGMLLSAEAMEFEHLEREEMLGYLPEIHGKSVLELGAGIGRYTQYFASVAQTVDAVEFVEKFVEANRLRNSQYENVDFHCADAMSVKFKNDSFDLVFVNWLMMYLSDENVHTLIKRIAQWLKPNGLFFIRESCFMASNPKTAHPNTHYRSDEFYTNCFHPYFRVLKTGNCKIYEKRYGNPNQLFWLIQKI